MSLTKNSKDGVKRINLKYFGAPKDFKLQYTLKNTDLKVSNVGVHIKVSDFFFYCDL